MVELHKRRQFLTLALMGFTGCLGRERGGIQITSPKQAELPYSELSIKVTNHTDEVVSPGLLTVWKVEGERPVYLHPVTPTDIFPQMGVRVGPGESETFEVTVDSEAETMDSFLPGAGPGTYLWGFLEEDHEPGEKAYQPHEKRVAETELVGEEPEIKPVYVEETEETDEGLRVKTKGEGDSNNADNREVVVLSDEDVQRSSPHDTPELIREQVFGFAVVRNAVYYLGVNDGTDRVILEGERVADERRVLEEVLGENGYPYFSSSGNRLFFNYDGESYRIKI